MPDCQICDWFDQNKRICTGGATSSIRNCVNAIIEKRSQIINNNDLVLEIGCGYQRQLRDMVVSQGARWYGLDPRRDSIATNIGSAKKIPFKDKYFDAVFASQSMEHWYERGTTFDEGLKEIHRVLKLEGYFSIDSPIYLHGHKIFMLSRETKINQMFDTSSWKLIENEDWRKNYYPLSPYYTWLGKRKKHSNELYCQKILKQMSASAYIKSVLVKKKSDRYHNINTRFQRISHKLLHILLMYYKSIRLYFMNSFYS